MAEVPYAGGVPTVEPETRAPDDLQHISATPQEFGGLIAQGEEKAGQGLEQAGTAAFDIAAFKGKINTDNAVNQYITYHDNVMYGDPSKTTIGPDGKPVPDTGFFGTQGRAASDQRPDALKSLEDQRETIHKTLPTPEEQFQFDAQTRRMYADSVQRTGLHADQQWKDWAGGVNTQGANLAMNGYLRNLNDPQAMASHASDYINLKVQEAQVKFGNDPTVMQQTIDGAKRDLLKAQVMAVSVNDPAGAQRILEKNKSIAGPEYEPLADHVRNRAEQQNGVSAAQQATTGAVQQFHATRPYANPALPVYSQVTETIPGGYSQRGLARTIQIESSGNPNVQPPPGLSPAHTPIGLGQFIPATWAAYGQGDPHDPEASIMATQNYAAANAQQLTRALGRAPTDPELYLAHQQGPIGATRLLTNPMARAGDIVGDAAISRNGGDPNAPAYVFTSMWTNKFNNPAAPLGPQVAGAMPRAPMPASDPYALHAASLQRVMTNPELNENERQHAIQFLNHSFTEAQVAAEADTKAKKDASDTAMSGYISGMINGGVATPQMVQQIGSDTSLTAEAKENLYRFATQDFGFESSTQFGPAYSSAYQRIFLPPDDPNKINDASDILKLGTPGGGLTPRGADRLMKVFSESRKNPDQVAVNSTKSSLIQYAKSKLSFDQETLIPGIKPLSDPKGQQVFNAQFIPRFEAAYDAWIKADKNPWEFLTQKNVDQLMEGLRPKAQMAADKVSAQGEVTGEPIANAPLPVAPDGVDQQTWGTVLQRPPVMATGQVATPQQYGAAIAILKETPTADVKTKFNKWFGTKGAMADDVLDKLNPQPAKAEQQPTPVAPAAVTAPRQTLGEEAEQGMSEANDLSAGARERALAAAQAARERQGGLLQ